MCVSSYFTLLCKWSFDQKPRIKVYSSFDLYAYSQSSFALKSIDWRGKKLIISFKSVDLNIVQLNTLANYSNIRIVQVGVTLNMHIGVSK